MKIKEGEEMKRKKAINGIKLLTRFERKACLLMDPATA